MKKLFCLILTLLLISCSSKNDPNLLIIPPNFAELPDPNNPEKPSAEDQEASVDKLKDLLLKSD